MSENAYHKGIICWAKRLGSPFHPSFQVRKSPMSSLISSMSWVCESLTKSSSKGTYGCRTRYITTISTFVFCCVDFFSGGTNSQQTKNMQFPQVIRWWGPSPSRPSASHVVDTFVAPTLRPPRSEGRPWGTGRMIHRLAAFVGGLEIRWG